MTGSGVGWQPTPEQIELSRHALGLDGRRKVSYRNRYITSGAHLDWDSLVANGHADFEKFGSADGPRRLYFLTPAGAALALRPGETLDTEDFPPTAGEG